MNRLRALLSRLDPWAALLLGVLVALGVIILLATPGPWQKVVESRQPIHIGKPPPTDIAVFSMRGTTVPRCTGVFWLHVDYERPSVALVAVPAAVEGFLPGAGYLPLATIVADAGGAAGAAALGAVTGVSMSDWVTAAPGAAKEAFSGWYQATQSRAGRERVRRLMLAWSGTGATGRVYRRQVTVLGSALDDMRRVSIDVVAFANYVLAAPTVETNLNLEAASSIGAVLRDAQPGAVCVRSLPVTAAVSGRSMRWRLDAGSTAIMRQSLAFGLTPPVFPMRVTVRHRAPLVLVALSPMGALARVYCGELQRDLRRSSGQAVSVAPLELRPGEDWAAAARLAVDRTRPLAVVVAIGWGRGRPAAAAPVQAQLNGLVDALGSLRQPALVSDVPAYGAGSWQGLDPMLLKVAATAGLPVSTPAETLMGGAVAGGTSAPVVVRSWARLNTAALIRGCDPVFFGPHLTSTRLGFSYARRRATTVTVLCGATPSYAQESGRLRNLGFATRQETLGSFSPSARRASVYYGARGQRAAARVLADDLHISSAQVIAAQDVPGGLMLYMP